MAPNVAQVDARAKAEFEEHTNNTILQPIVLPYSTRYYFYVSNANIERAGVGPAAYAAIRSKVLVVKLLKPHNRYLRENARPDLEILDKIRGHGHPNIVPILSIDQRRRNWVTFGYVGISLRVVDRFWFTLPNAFLWSLTRDIAAGLAYLHWGVPSNWTNGSAVPALWNPIANISISSSTVHLDVTNVNQFGYPRAVLTELADVSHRPRRRSAEPIPVDQWVLAKKDVSDAAFVLHWLAHGLNYARRPHPVTSNYCWCLEDSHCPVWLTPAVMDRELASVLEMSYPWSDPEQLTSKALLAHVNDPRGFSRKFPSNAPRIPADDFAKLTPAMPSNGAIRTANPSLRRVYENAEDERTGDADLMG